MRFLFVVGDRLRRNSRLKSKRLAASGTRIWCVCLATVPKELTGPLLNAVYECVDYIVEFLMFVIFYVEC